MNISELETKLPTLKRFKVVVGFDAFIDETIRVVAKRGHGSMELMDQMEHYGSWVNASAGRSGLREVVSENVSAGGCSVNMGDGLSTFGVSILAYIGFGKVVHPVFNEFQAKCCRVVNTGIEPGRTTVHEFKDGKLMLCYLSHLASFDGAFVRKNFKDTPFILDCKSADAIVFTTWSVFPNATDAWRTIGEEILKDITHRPHIFFDIADPASRSGVDLKEVLGVISNFEKCGRVTLSLNGNEANQVAQVLGLPKSSSNTKELESQAQGIRERMGISEICIHLIKSATVATQEEVATVMGPYCEFPKKSVGAGDRFNAGYLSGILLTLGIQERLILGCASSGYFVRNGVSATPEALAETCRTWKKNGNCGDLFSP